MSNLVLPNLSDWHEVPAESGIPEDVPYAVTGPGTPISLVFAHRELTSEMKNKDFRFFTEKEIPPAGLMDGSNKAARMDDEGDVVIWTKKGWTYVLSGGIEDLRRDWGYVPTLEEYEDRFSQIVGFL